MKNVRKWILHIVPVLLLLVSIGMALYPTFSSRWNDEHQSSASVEYQKAVEKLDDTDYAAVMASARAYNERHNAELNPYDLSEEEMADYESQLNPNGNGMMGTIEIPSIDVFYPIYHGTSDEVLQVAIGHVEWSSLPTGDPGTHCVLSGHTGSSVAKLFTNLDRMQVGDRFTLTVMKEKFTYEVDQIIVVVPEAVRIVMPEPEKDYCSLITCTPFGVNSHRLVVRGVRVYDDAQTGTEEMQSVVGTDNSEVVTVQEKGIQEIWNNIIRTIDRIPDTAKILIGGYAALCVSIIIIVMMARKCKNK